MNKALHVFVYVFLALACTALWFELELNKKRTELTDRNMKMEDYIVKIARTIEKEGPAKDAAIELRKDVSPVEAKLVDTPDTEDLLEDYVAYYEKPNLDTYEWDGSKERDALRSIYILDPEGKPMQDMSGRNIMDGAPMIKSLEKLFNSSKDMQSRLNSTRAELAKVRGLLEDQVNELNALKPEARQDKVTIEEKKAEITKLESDVAERDNTIVKIKAEIDELNAEISSLKDEVQAAKDETEEKRDELDKAKKLIEQLKKMLHDTMQQLRNSGNTSNVRGTAVTSIPAGDKGKIVQADNDMMFAVIEFTDEAMKELKGPQLDHPLPALELGVKRGETFVGRVRLRQEVRGKNLVICDILSAWEQDKLTANDAVFAD